jgi:hypothetical protein
MTGGAKGWQGLTQATPGAMGLATVHPPEETGRHHQVACALPITLNACYANNARPGLAEATVAELRALQVRTLTTDQKIKMKRMLLVD